MRRKAGLRAECRTLYGKMVCQHFYLHYEFDTYWVYFICSFLPGWNERQGHCSCSVKENSGWWGMYCGILAFNGKIVFQKPVIFHLLFMLIFVSEFFVCLFFLSSCCHLYSQKVHMARVPIENDTRMLWDHTWQCSMSFSSTQFIWYVTQNKKKIEMN